MKISKNEKGFTLIELLIVIVIIGILAVAFLPQILSAPAKARDTQRVADLQNFQKALINGDLESIDYPGASACFDGLTLDDTIIAALGGVLPTDPQETNALAYSATDTCTGQYVYMTAPATAAATSPYSFGLYAKLENPDQANTSCAEVAGATPGVLVAPDGTAEDNCYAILTQ